MSELEPVPPWAKAAMQNVTQDAISAPPSLPESDFATSVTDSKDKEGRWKPTDIPQGAVAEETFVCTDCPQPYRYPTSSPYWIWWRPMVSNFEHTVLHSFVDDAGEQFDIVRITRDFSPYILSSHSIRCQDCSSKARRYYRAKAQMQNLRFSIGGRNLKSVRFSRTLASWRDQCPEHEEIAKEVRARTNRFRVFRQSDGFLEAMGKNHCGVWFREIVLRAWATHEVGVSNQESIQVDWDDPDAKSWTANIHFHCVIASSTSKKFWDMYDGDLRSAWGDPIHVQNLSDSAAATTYLTKNEGTYRASVSRADNHLIEYVQKEPVSFGRTMSPFGTWKPNADATRVLEETIRSGQVPSWVRKNKFQEFLLPGDSKSTAETSEPDSAQE